MIGLIKFINHLWYLREKNIAFAFFDEDVPEATKENMWVLNLTEDENNNRHLEDEDECEPKKRVYQMLAEVKDVIENSLEQFASQKTKNFCTGFNIFLTFLMNPVPNRLLMKVFFVGKKYCCMDGEKYKINVRISRHSNPSPRLVPEPD